MPSPAPSVISALTVSGGLALSVYGMLTLSLPRIVSGALLWLVGIMLGEKSPA